MPLPDAAAGLAGVALFLAVGTGVVEWVPALRALPWSGRLAYGYLLGVAWTAGGLYSLSHLVAVPLRLPAILTLAAVPALAGLVHWLQLSGPKAGTSDSDVRRRGRPRWLRLLSRLAVIAGVVVSLAVFAEAVTNPLRDWDGRMTWVAQARFVRAAGTVDAPVLRGREWFVTHPRYPLLLPVAQVAVLEVTAKPDDSRAAQALYAAFFPAFLLLLHAGARQLAGKGAAAAVVLAATVVPFLPFYSGGGAAGCYSDLPLACLYGGGLLLLLGPPAGGSEGGRRRLAISSGLAAGLLLAGAVLTKNEGALLGLWALGLAAASGLARWRRGRVKRPGGRTGLLRVAAAAVPVVLALALLVSWRSGIPNRFDEMYERTTTFAALWPAVVTRIPLLVPIVLRPMLAGAHWTLLWWVAPIVLYAGRRGLRRRATLPLVLAALVPPAIAWLAYTVSPTPEFLAAVTWNRFLVQAAIPFFLLLALALRVLLRGVPRAERARPLDPVSLPRPTSS